LWFNLKLTTIGTVDHNRINRATATITPEEPV
jgi:hypothetical protein